MLDVDKWPILYQVLTGVGVVVGSILAGLLGIRAGRKAPGDERDAELAAAHAKIRDNELRREFEQIISATRRSFFDEGDKIRSDFKGELDDARKRIADMEREVAILKMTRRRGSAE